MSRLISILALVLILTQNGALAVEKTVMLDLESSWHHGSTQIQKLTTTLEVSGEVTDNSAFTAIIRGEVTAVSYTHLTLPTIYSV